MNRIVVCNQDEAEGRDWVKAAMGKCGRYLVVSITSPPPYGRPARLPRLKAPIRADVFRMEFHDWDPGRNPKDPYRLIDGDRAIDLSMNQQQAKESWHFLRYWSAYTRHSA